MPVLLSRLNFTPRNPAASSSCGMVINPTRELTIDAYRDADFAGMYGHEKPTDPACARSRSGFVIVFDGVLVLWQSKL